MHRHISTSSALTSAIALLTIGSLAGCQSAPVARDSSEGVRVAASFYPLAYLATQVGGSYATVTTLTPAGAEPHAYEPTPRDMVTVTGSDILLLNGSGLEPWGQRVQEQLRGSDTTVVILGEPLATRQIVLDGEQARDPHVWLDPTRAADIGQRIAEAFARIDPAHAEVFASNADALTAKLTALDSKYRESLASCALREIVTTHVAFGYLTDRYQLTHISISGISPEEEPSAKQLAEVATLVREKGIRTIFFEQLVSPRLAEAVARETGATTLILDPIEGISEADQRAGIDYMTLMESNLTNLRQALQCTTP